MRIATIDLDIEGNAGPQRQGRKELPRLPSGKRPVHVDGGCTPSAGRVAVWRSPRCWTPRRFPKNCSSSMTRPSSPRKVRSVSSPSGLGNSATSVTRGRTRATGEKEHRPWMSRDGFIQILPTSGAGVRSSRGSCAGPEAQLQECFDNCTRKVIAAGGAVQYGWAFCVYERLLQAFHHAVWRSPEGVLIDITPLNIGPLDGWSEAPVLA